MKEYIKEAIDRKYKISFFKGVNFAYESIILFILMVSIIMKANIFSLVYLIFIFRYLTSRHRVNLMVRLVVYMSICFMLQYFFYVLNLIDNTSPSPYPRFLSGYPKNEDPHDFTIKYALPLFF